ncbi:uncharacterized protein LOC112575561 [Pomacea canaliculata]|uniref:uncharacterized protein LOC112575561 n=1 Tax=Pomacea canaliculata TaxID=400727 RepID=UPI000D73C4B5|nr:uncharacterized protein LOC112575561 [Pomacea canaliculata]XP_025113290.1 uncharacterized protein LOC112575561 [Pomacea canaliculata]
MTTTMVETTREGWGWVQSLAAARAQIYVEMASAWRRVRRFFFPKMLMAAAASLLVAGLVQQSPNVQLEPLDVLVYSSIYCSWAVFCLPDILIRFNFRFIRRTLVIILLLYQSELSMSIWQFVRSHVTELNPMTEIPGILGPGLQWIQGAATSLRFVLLLTCLSTTVMAYLYDWPELFDDNFLDNFDDPEELS